MATIEVPNTLRSAAAAIVLYANASSEHRSKEMDKIVIISSIMVCRELVGGLTNEELLELVAKGAE